MTSRKKLIEVAMPLEAINIASAREKSIRHGHPSTLHLWWARRPLAAARAVIFAQMVDDPSSLPDLFPTEKAQQRERERLFRIIRDLVLWENTTNEAVLQRARDEIWQSWRRACADNADHPRAKELFDRHKLPAFHDPFAGGGSLPLEAQRLGLEAYASDLNPVAVLINKATIEIPPKFAGRPPVNPTARADRTLLAREWPGATGLAEDVRYYGEWMRDEAERRIGHLYPKIDITDEMAKERPDLKSLVGQKLTVIAWLWARTVKSPNPAFAQVDVPLVSTFLLSTRAGREAFVQPLIEANGYRFAVKVGSPRGSQSAQQGTSAGKRAAFRCLMSDAPISYDYIRSEGQAGRLGSRLMAIVTDSDRGRLYLSPTADMEAVARQAQPDWRPETPLEGKCRVNVSNYGLDTYGDLFTPRQLVALTTFSDLVREARELVQRAALTAGMSGETKSLRVGGTGAAAYADALAVYLGFCVDKASLTNTTGATWQKDPDRLTQAFARQAIPMVWDFAEANPLSHAGGGFGITSHAVGKVLERLPAQGTCGEVLQQDATAGTMSLDRVVSTDPPYYDNISYADLSDYFYVWLRRSLKPVFPDLFTTVAAPKAEELVATPYRHGSKEKAEEFFLDGMTQAMHRLAEQAHSAFPVTIYYAFKQSESDDEEGIANTGWDTFLEAVIRAGFAISGTWPMRTELTGNLKKGMASLASSIILVCRWRATDAPTATRREFAAALKAELPVALADLQRGNIAPVDLAQAAIGPGMAIYTRYGKVVAAEGKPLSVREALALINETLDEALADQEGDFDQDTRFALTWFDQCGFAEGDFGDANTLAIAKVTSVDGLVEAGILAAGRGKVRLLKAAELPADWDPVTDKRLTTWETVHHLIRVLDANGEAAAAELVAKLGSRAETARELCYRLYALCERKKRAADALSYNALVQSWPEIVRLARESATPHAGQGGQLQFGDLE